jgi:hypothetical protein
MDTSYVRRVIILGFLIIFMAAIAGCSQPESKPAPGQGNDEQNKPIPSLKLTRKICPTQPYIIQSPPAVPL